MFSENDVSAVDSFLKDSGITEILEPWNRIKMTLEEEPTNSSKLPHLCNTCTEVTCPLATITNTSTVKSGKIAFNVYACEYYNKNKISSNDKNYRGKEKGLN